MKLNLGCGNKYQKGWINVDYCNKYQVDIIHDLNKYPYPFKDNTADEILFKHSLEHIDSIKALEEAYRICKYDGKVIIEVPFGTNGFNHIQHTKQFNWDTFKGLKSPYLNFEFKLIKQFPLNNQKKGIGKIRNYIPKDIVKCLSYIIPIICQNMYVELKPVK